MLSVRSRAHKISKVNKMNTKREERKRAAIERQIDENLKRVYEEDAKQALPDRFRHLLEQLREQG